MSITAIRASILHFPKATTQPDSDHIYHADGGLIVDNGKILACTGYAELKDNYPDADWLDYSGKLLVPGLIDSHMHFPQTEMLACYGEQLLQWLENYTFPTERKFENEEYATALAKVFLRQFHRNGTTTPFVYSSVHKSATNALFSVANDVNMLIVAGKVCMDRHCPEWLQDCPTSAQQESAELIDKWHGRNRCHYAITPRFAPTSTDAQMAALGELAQQYPDVFIQTHLSENSAEIEWVKQLYPQHHHYLDVYDHFGMVRPRAIYGHCLHLEPAEWQLMADKQATIAVCPTSNLFLGSGLFDMQKAHSYGIKLALATDIGGGTSFSLLKTMAETYKVCQLKGYKLSPFESFYHVTQGAAVAHALADKIGNLNPGTDADFVIFEPAFDELTELRLQGARSSLSDQLFTLQILGDDRATHSTWIAGKPIYQKKEMSLNAVA